jgi:23S rRNA (guanine1835-N2)-methyltransferase
LLLQQLPVLSPVERLVDLACGNGVLGLAAFRMQLARQVLYCDESAMAVASAKYNARQLFPTAFERFEFLHGDGLLDYRGTAAQLVLCNPPFHSQHTVDEYVGRRLLAQCSEHLAAGGSLCLVANRHLDYKATLKRGFDRVEKLAGDSKFTVWLAHRNARE